MQNTSRHQPLVAVTSPTLHAGLTHVSTKYRDARRGRLVMLGAPTAGVAHFGFEHLGRCGGPVCMFTHLCPLHKVFGRLIPVLRIPGVD